jgi:hypothetical protein
MIDMKKQPITKEAFWELLNGLIEEKEEKEIADLEEQLLKQYYIVDNEVDEDGLTKGDES